MLKLLLIIQLAPLIACISCIAFNRSPKKAPIIGIAGALVGCLSTLGVWLTRPVDSHEGIVISALWLPTQTADTFSFFGFNTVPLSNIFIGFYIDNLNLLMLSIVAFVSLMVQIFSAYYMSHDKDISRYFAFLSLFSFTMIGLILSENLLQLFMFWELVGLASYLLIGFWYQKKSATQAAKKAFILNRLADLGFILGIFLVFFFSGTLSIHELHHDSILRLIPGSLCLFIGVLLFMGVMGKSAQFPFHVWLPDAMEGPTPVSALIHSATMVAAGVFLLIRVFDIFALSSVVLLIILITGTLTSLSSGILATIQSDIKKVLAYSTVSQLGLMVMAIGVSQPAIAMFHLTTHAFFKSMLFLTAGVFIHRYSSNDIYEIGEKGAKSHPAIMLILLVGIASLTGIPPFSGFFSKEAILHELMHFHPALGYMGLIITGLTAYYAWRVVFILYASKVSNNDVHAETKTEFSLSHFPIFILAASSIAVGFLGSPVYHEKLLHWIDAHIHLETPSLKSLGITFGVIAACMLVAWFRERHPDTRHRVTSRSLLKHIMTRNFYVDDFFNKIVKGISVFLAKIFYNIDTLIPNKLFVDKTAHDVRWIGSLASRVHNGLLQNYLFITLLFILIILFVSIQGAFKN